MEKKLKKRLSRRLKIIEGQVRGLQKMIEDERYCIDVITQSSAIRHSLDSFEDIMLENHLRTHAMEQMRGAQVERATEEILKVYKLAKKN